MSGRPDAAAALTQVIRGSKRDLGTTSGPDSLAQAATSGLAVPATEQEIAAHNGLFPAARLVAAYPKSAVPADYPFVVLTTDPERRAQAAELLTRLQSAQSREQLAKAGFRDGEGAAGSGLTGQPGVDPSRPGSGAIPDAAGVSAASRTLTSITRGSKLLAVLDVSGSMGTPVPEAGAPPGSTSPCKRRSTASRSTPTTPSPACGPAPPTHSDDRLSTGRADGDAGPDRRPQQRSPAPGAGLAASRRPTARLASTTPSWPPSARCARTGTRSGSARWCSSPTVPTKTRKAASTCPRC